MIREDVVIVPYRDGPYLVRGPVRLEDQNGREIDPGRGTFALCRCGKSRVRPFCDGSHQLVRFRSPSEREERREAREPSPAGARDREPRQPAARNLAAIERSLSALERRVSRLEEDDPALTQIARHLSAAASLLAAKQTRTDR